MAEVENPPAQNVESQEDADVETFAFQAEIAQLMSLRGFILRLIFGVIEKLRNFYSSIFGH